MKTWTELIEWAKKEGFKVGYNNNFKGFFDKKEEEVIMYNEEKGLILYAESFDGNVNHASIYGEITYDEDYEKSFPLGFLSSFCYEDEKTIVFELDYRRGLSLINQIPDSCEFSKVWKNKRFLWFVNHMEKNKEGYDFEKINHDKIQASSPEVRKIIFG